MKMKTVGYLKPTVCFVALQWFDLRGVVAATQLLDVPAGYSTNTLNGPAAQGAYLLRIRGQAGQAMYRMVQME